MRVAFQLLGDIPYAEHCGVSGKGGYEETNSERGNRKRKPEVETGSLKKREKIWFSCFVCFIFPKLKVCEN